MLVKNLKWIYLILLSIVWGSSFILIKKGLVGLTPLQLGSFRIIFASLFLIAVGFKSLFKIKKEQWKLIILKASSVPFFRFIFLLLPKPKLTVQWHQFSMLLHL